ncbi:hypothetical protein HHK36_032817 [Tetracentron sinense]|uniref:Glucosamine-phosphate N-acetyltransferase n=1 Tax=Tetracentron sinense TaxID=13715 RepID=A0A834Y4D2_TETSI|nr:hypothetical protein HHK36_032817 [Tetracentron sinense]
MVIGAVPFLKRLILTDDAPLFFFTDSCIILGEAMIPCILLALGGNLVDGPGSSKLGLRTTAAIIFGRLVLVPPAGLGIVMLADKLGFLPPGDKMFRFILLLQHTMPTSVLSGAVASLRGCGRDAAAVLFWVHIFAIFSMAGFPNLDPHGRVEPVDLDKLRIALSHSSVIVSVFCKPHFSSGHRSKDETTISKSEFGFGELFERALPVTESNGQLVGFGRAVSDNGLTASIYDVMTCSSSAFMLGLETVGCFVIKIVNINRKATMTLDEDHGANKRLSLRYWNGNRREIVKDHKGAHK